MRTTINLSADGFDIAADIARLQAVQESIAGTLAQVASDYGNPAVLTAAREIRGTLSMSNNRQGRELDTLPIVRTGDAGHAETEIVAVPRGAWHLVEYGAKPHEIRPRRRSGFRAMPTRYGFYSKVNHPGTAGTGVWTRAMEQAEPLIDAAVQDAFDAAVNGGAPSQPGT